MTSDGDALFRAICEQPWEDTPRLIYADWLEEHGDPLRAEFIRVQIEQVCENTPERVTELAARAKALHAQSRGAWTRGSPSGCGVRVGRDLVRGFYHQVSFDAADLFVTRSAGAFAWTPIDSVTIVSHTPAWVARVLSSSLLARVARLMLWGPITDACCLALARCPHLANLTALCLNAASVTDDGGFALLDAPFARKCHLRLTGTIRLNEPTRARLSDRFAALALR